MILFIEYPKCSTCQKAKKWLIEHNIKFEARDIKLENPKSIELKKWHEMSQLPIKSFFNTSGLVYKALELKDKLEGMSIDEKYAILATDGMLIKRPVLIAENTVLLGFKEEKWAEALLGNKN